MSDKSKLKLHYRASLSPEMSTFEDWTAKLKEALGEVQPIEKPRTRGRNAAVNTIDRAIKLVTTAMVVVRWRVLVEYPELVRKATAHGLDVK